MTINRLQSTEDGSVMTTHKLLSTEDSTVVTTRRQLSADDTTAEREFITAICNRQLNCGKLYTDFSLIQ